MTKMTIDQLRPLETTDELVAIMVDGFFDDPLYRWMYPPAVRPDRLAETFDLMLDAGAASGVVDVARRRRDGAVVGIAIWTTEGAPLLGDVHLERFQQMVTDHLGARAGVVAESMAACEQLVPSEPHAVLHNIVVAPGARGQQVGAALLGGLLAHADRSNVPVHLDSSNPRNLSFYRRHGWVEVGDVRLPDGPVMQAMHRASRSGWTGVHPGSDPGDHPGG